MQQRFTITRKTFNVEASQAYFDSLALAATQALVAERVGSEEAFAACEYIDIVDAGTLQMDKALYRQCVALIGEYLCASSEEAALALACKSWAAKTLMEVLAPMRTSEAASGMLVSLLAA